MKPEDKGLYVGMTDGLLSIKNRRRHDPKSAEFKEQSKQLNKPSFNSYKYINPSLVNTSPVKTLRIFIFLNFYV